MSLEGNQRGEVLSREESESNQSIKKTHQIRKNPKSLTKIVSNKPYGDSRMEPAYSSLRLLPQFGMFESEVQKHLRLQKFWREQVDNYYKNEISDFERNNLIALIEQDVPTLKEVMEREKKPAKVPFQQLYRYVQLVRQCRVQKKNLALIETQGKKFLGIFTQERELERMVSVNSAQAYLICQRQHFMTRLHQRQAQYNEQKGTRSYLSEISEQIAFLLFIMRRNKQSINQQALIIYNRIVGQQSQKVSECQNRNVEDRYRACLIRKNLRLALENNEIDYFNYFRNLDAYEQYGKIENDKKPITDKRQFQEYVRKKKNKKQRKSKAVLKSACAGCLSPHTEQYNPLLNCSQCQVRFHKYCYTPNAQELCEPCMWRKSNTVKGRPIQCQLCPNKGFLSLPLKQMRENVSIHIFCMLINGLWKFQNGILEFKSANYQNNSVSNEHNELCSICDAGVYTYQCSNCARRAHPLCAYLSGWYLQLNSQDQLSILCCGDFDKQKISKRRKFILNYKRCVFKCESEK